MRVALLLVGVLLAGCRPAPSRPGAARPVAASKPLVVATIFPLADLCRGLVGDEAEVVTLVPPGASPHTFELTADAMRSLSRAKLIVRVGPGVDEWLDSALAGQPATVFVAMDHVKLLDGNPEHPGEGLDKDPHCWLDPYRLATEVAPALTAALPLAKPAASARLEQCTRALTALDAELQRQLAPLKQRRYIAAHPAWRYFNERYHLTMAACVEPVGGGEPSASWLSEVVKTAKTQGLGAVLGEVQLSDKLVRTVADEAKLRVGLLDPLGGEAVPGRDSYAALMRYNAQQFVEALR